MSAHLLTEGQLAVIAENHGVSMDLARHIADAAEAMCASGTGASKAVASCNDEALGSALKFAVRIVTESAAHAHAVPMGLCDSPASDASGAMHEEGERALRGSVSEQLDQLNRELTELRLSRDIYVRRVEPTSFGGVIATLVKVGEREQ